ncbi:MAG: hypothetical protein DRP13_02715 [Candidatus Aenigmatarchaeota archaeon]|nr:MAG: hypothetical protein DRP13_02715 [Candidatus Aenigmarchaeota archaeon]
MAVMLKVPRYRQPPMMCGATALAEVMEYFDGKKYNIKEIAKETEKTYKNIDWLFAAGLFAMKRGFKSKIITISTEIFDPSWTNLTYDKLIRKMRKRLEYLLSKKTNDSYIIEWNISPLKWAIKYLEKGGELFYHPITTKLIKTFLEKRIPLIVPINENLFHGIKRTTQDDEYDDIKGMGTGHVVVISGFRKNKFIIIDSEIIAERFRGKRGKVEKEFEILLNCMSAGGPPSLFAIYK